jgi:PBP1b-binding outer membrane lipoprotein LpoB
MKKFILLALTSIVVLSCSTQKQANKSVNERDVPERYVKDFTRQRPNVEKRTWEMIDSTSYNVNFVDNGNQMKIKYLKAATETSWIVPLEYVPSSITDYIKNNYPTAKIKEVAIVDSKNLKTYHAIITPSKKETKVLEFDLQGNFKSEVN